MCLNSHDSEVSAGRPASSLDLPRSTERPAVLFRYTLGQPLRKKGRPSPCRKQQNTIGHEANVAIEVNMATAKAVTVLQSNYDRFSFFALFLFPNGKSD